jgi:hypothetical protein
VSKTAFRFLTSLNEAPSRARTYGGSSHVFPAKVVERYFASDRLTDRFIRALIDGHAIRWKEILESFEFFYQTRKYLRRSSMADVCCGHGLIGILFALLEEKVEKVLLADIEIPPKLPSILDIAIRLGPWVKEKITISKAEIEALHSQVSPGTAIVSAHGCGSLTDQALDLAISVGGPVAAMPCCCHPRSPDAPAILYRELGVKDGVDVHRTYRLNDAGYEVLWKYIPEEITPMNRIILGTKKDTDI